MTKGGRFAAVTNYRDPNAPKGIASRGDIVAEFLRSEKVAEEYLETAQRRVHEFSGYNLLVGEINDRRNELYYFSNRMGSIERLPSGLYGLSNKFLDTPWPKVEKGKAALAQQLQDDPVSRDSLFNILRDESLADDESLPDTGIGYHREKLLSAIFIKTPDYGTRCSTLLTVDKNLKLDMEERVFV